MKNLESALATASFVLSTALMMGLVRNETFTKKEAIALINAARATLEDPSAFPAITDPAALKLADQFLQKVESDVLSLPLQQ